MRGGCTGPTTSDFRRGISVIRLAENWVLLTSKLVSRKHKFLQFRQFGDSGRNLSCTKSSENSKKRGVVVLVQPLPTLGGQIRWFDFKRGIQVIWLAENGVLLTSKLVLKKIKHLQSCHIPDIWRDLSCTKSSENSKKWEVVVLAQPLPISEGWFEQFEWVKTINTLL